MNYIAFDSYTGEVDFVSAETMKAIEQTSEPGRYSFHEEPNFDWLDEMEEHFKQGLTTNPFCDTIGIRKGKVMQNVKTNGL